jgi:cyclic pyranopterin phosphate synthase
MSHLTHTDEHGKAHMVDVGDKEPTRREATAQAVVRMQPETMAALRANALKKGDALGTARIAAIMAAKRVDELIPLCHSLPLSGVDIDFEMADDHLRIVATARTIAPTGVEMEALTAATTAALTIYDMVKAIDKRLVIEAVHLLKKTGGRSGDFTWNP